MPAINPPTRATGLMCNVPKRRDWSQGSFMSYCIRKEKTMNIPASSHYVIKTDRLFTPDELRGTFWVEIEAGRVKHTLTEQPSGIKFSMRRVSLLLPASLTSIFMGMAGTTSWKRAAKLSSVWRQVCPMPASRHFCRRPWARALPLASTCLLYTSDAADDPLCVDLGGRR